MKIIVQLLVLIGLAASAASSSAAPRAAEDMTAMVTSTSASAPSVKREAPGQTKTAEKHKKAPSKKTTKAH